MKGLGAFLLIIGAVCVAAALANLQTLGSVLASALGSASLWLQGSSFGMKNATVCLYAGAIALVAGIVLLCIKRPGYHRH